GTVSGSPQADRRSALPGSAQARGFRGPLRRRRGSVRTAQGGRRLRDQAVPRLRRGPDDVRATGRRVRKPRGVLEGYGPARPVHMPGVQRRGLGRAQGEDE
ncbi:hypothetical protein THAOC_27629, partial [Thalassiosira oceanica]